MKRFTDEQIAAVCYNANAMLQDALGDSHVPPPWHVMTPAQRAPYIKAVRLTGIVTPREQHQCWHDDKARAGWTYGEHVDEERKTHPYMLPWELLTDRQRAKDEVFQAIVRAMS